MRVLIIGAAIAASLSSLAGLSTSPRASVQVAVNGVAYEPPAKPARESPPAKPANVLTAYRIEAGDNLCACECYQATPAPFFRGIHEPHTPKALRVEKETRAKFEPG